MLDAFGNGAGDHNAANGHGRAVAVCDYDGAIQAVGDAPNEIWERRSGATGGRGFEGGRSIPSPDPNVRTLGRLAHGA